MRHLVALHGGQVQAQSPGTGWGTTITIKLPTLSTLPTLPTLPDAAAVRLDGVRVLLVDDEAGVRAIAERVLQDAGAQVRVASQASQGLALLQPKTPTVILSDIGMAGIDGHDFMRRVRSLDALHGGMRRAAAFNAYTRPEDRQRSRDAGYQRHLGSPAPPIELVQAVARLVALRP